MFRWAEAGKQSWESLKICKNGKIHDMKIEWKSINRDKVRAGGGKVGEGQL